VTLWPRLPSLYPNSLALFVFLLVAPPIHPARPSLAYLSSFSPSHTSRRRFCAGLVGDPQARHAPGRVVMSTSPPQQTPLLETITTPGLYLKPQGHGRSLALPQNRGGYSQEQDRHNSSIHPPSSPSIHPHIPSYPRIHPLSSRRLPVCRVFESYAPGESIID
jgi:hypothetical protein